MNLTTEQLRSLFFESFGHFIEAETENILFGTSERNLCSRLAMSLEPAGKKAGLENYKADIEYNRMQDARVKTILDNEMHEVQITCDLILHSRGRYTEHDNLIAVEMKRLEHPDSEKKKDRIRLIALTRKGYEGVYRVERTTNPEYVCGYVLGYFLELNFKNRCFAVEEYENGELVQESIVSF